MKLAHGKMTVEVLAGKRIIKTGAVGAVTAEEVRWMTNALVTNSVAWKATGWAYIADISKMSPAAPDVSQELVTLHTKLATAGCRAVAFVEGNAIFLAAQAKQHQKQAHASFLEGHFKTEDEALKWVSTIVK
ncbi:MAG: hypothetical protein IKV41_00370 [Oscillospiraceae bacterium]|nr:hypothetical protein [Oscillospiraceae bacterium]